MRIAILADICANEIALDAVLARVAELHVDTCWFIGDLFCGGPDPIAVVDQIRALNAGEQCLLNGLDAWVLSGNMFGVSFGSRECALWSRSQLRPRIWDRVSRLRWRWLCERAFQGRNGDCRMLAHTLVTPNLGMGDADSLAQEFALVEHGAFVGTCGHPALYFEKSFSSNDVVEDTPVRIKGRRFLAHPGSVGRLSGRDPRACFAVYDGENITWHRVSYDTRETARRIRLIPERWKFGWMAEALEGRAPWSARDDGQPGEP